MVETPDRERSDEARRALEIACEPLRKALQESEERFRTLADHIHQFAWMADACGSITWFNARWLEYTGTKLEEMVGWGWTKVHHPDHVERVRERLQRSWNTGEPWEDTFPLRAKDGTYRWFLSRAQPIRDASGRIVRWIGTNTDVTELKQAQDALRESEATLSAIVERLPVAVTVLDAAGHVTTFNDASVKIHGAASREAMLAEFERYCELFELLDLQGRPLPEEQWPFRRALRGEDVRGLDLKLRRKGGAERIVEYFAAPVRSSNGEIGSVVFVLHDITERKLAQDALRESEERYRLINRATNDVIWDWDLVTGHMHWNEALHAAFGYDVAEVPPTLEWWSERLPADERDQVVAGLEAVIEGTDETWQDVYRFRKADGTYASILDRGYVYRHEGRAVRMIGSMLDMTERLEAERALRESESFYRQTLESIPGMTFTCRPDGSCDYVSEQWVEFTGEPAPVFLGDGWVRVVHPEDVERVLRAWRDAVEERAGFDLEYRIRRRDGVYEWFKVRGRAIRDEAGRIDRWFGAAINVNDLKEAEQRLLHQAQLLNLSHEPILAWRPEGEIVEWNAGAEQLYGYSREEALGRHIHELLRSELVDGGFEFRSEPERTNEWRGELRQRAKDGREIVVECRRQLVASGGQSLVLASSRDVTERKRTEVELRQYREHLEQLVQERTAELDASRERLRLSERMASIGTLAAGLGHDMGNVLMPMRVRLETLEAMGLAEPALREIERIRASAEYLRKLAAGLKLLSLDPKSGVGGESTDLASWWSETETVIRNALPHGVELKSDLEPCGAATVAMSKPALTQAVFNIVQNSCDAMKPAGSGTVTVAARCQDGTVKIDISDTGPGMTEEVRRRCMEPFFTTKPRGMSTGLGLTLVYGLVHEAGGSIELESAPGKGTRFTLVLPLQRKPGGSAAGPARTRRAFVDLRDPRVRSYVTSELRNLSFEVRLDAAESAGDDDLVVVEVPPKAGQRGRVVPVGHKPRLSEVKASLLAAAGAGT